MFTFHLDKEPILETNQEHKLNCELTKDCDIHKLDVASETMDGSLTYYKTADNIYFLLIDLQVHSCTEFYIKSSNSKKGLYLFYNIGEGFSLKNLDKKLSLESDKLHIGMPQSCKAQSIVFSENTKAKLVIIQTDFVELVEDNFCENESLPSSISKAKDGFYQDLIQKKTLNGQMRDLINKCMTNEQLGIERKMNLEAHCKELTAMAIGTVGRYRSTYDNTAAALNNKEREAIHTVARILEEKYRNPPLQAELSREVGLNVNKMTSGFKILYGETINKYLLKQRMAKAKSLLIVDNDFTVSEIAEAVGFRNASYFIKKFKECYGETPGVYV